MAKQENKAKNEEAAPKSKGKRAKRVLLSALGVAVIITATVLIVLYIVGNVEAVETERPTLSTGARGTLITMENLDDVRAELARPLEDTSYTAIMNVEWTFPRWDMPSANAYVENSTMNTRTVFFELVHDGTGEIIYSSPYIPLGGRLEYFALDTEVPAGQHTATLIYFLVDDDMDVITDVSVRVWLNILG